MATATELSFKDDDCFMEQISVIVNKYTRLKLTNECLEERIEDLENENEQYDHELTELRQHFQEHRAMLEKQLSVQKSQHEQEIADLNEAHRAEIIGLQRSLMEARTRVDVSPASSDAGEPEHGRMICECGANIARSSRHKHKESATHRMRLKPLI
jgi:hypothetical protein